MNFTWIPSDTLSIIDNEHIRQIATLWSASPIAYIDTLHTLDQWIPFGELKKEMLIYKIHFADDAKTQLYISSQSGEVLTHFQQERTLLGMAGSYSPLGVLHLATARRHVVE